jgi:hypothetical protein
VRDNADRECHREQQCRVVRNVVDGFVNAVEANCGTSIPMDQAADRLARGKAAVYSLGDPAGGPAIIPSGDPIGWDHEGDEKDHGNGGNLAAAEGEPAVRGVFPNPVRSESTMRFAAPVSGETSVAAGLPAGAYVVRLESAEAMATVKFVVLD